MLLEADTILLERRPAAGGGGETLGFAAAYGGARLTDGVSTVEAEEIVYDLDRRVGFARKATVYTTRPAAEAEVEWFSRARKLARGVDEGTPAPPRKPPEPIFVRAEEVRIDGARLSATDASITTCDFARPHWTIRSREVVLEPGIMLRASGNRLCFGSVTVLPLPHIARDLSRPAAHPSFDLAAAVSDRWGAEAGLRFGIHFPARPGSPVVLEDLLFGVDYRQKRGWGGDVRMNVRTGSEGRTVLGAYLLGETLISAWDDTVRATTNAARRGPKVLGTPLRLYNETALFDERRAAEGGLTPDTTTPLLYSGDLRYHVDLFHRTSLPGGWEIDGELHRDSDRDFRHEYAEFLDKHDPSPPSFLAARRIGVDTVFETLVLSRLNPWETRSEYLPEVRWNMPGRGIGGGFVLSAGASAGYLRRRFDEMTGHPSFETLRTHGEFRLSRPVSFWGLTLAPYLGGSGSFYGRARSGEDDVFTGNLSYGASLSTRIVGRYDFPSRETGLIALRHVIEPVVAIRGATRPTHAPADILDFDAVDDLSLTSRLSFSLTNRLQVKRRRADGTVRTREVAAFTAEVTTFLSDEEARRLNSGRHLDALRLSFLSRPSPRLTLFAGTEIDLHGEGPQVVSGGLQILPEGPEGSFALSLTHRGRFADPLRGVPGSSQLAAEVHLRLSDKWTLDAGEGVEFLRGADVPRGFVETRISLRRDFHDFSLSFSFKRDRADDETSASIDISPRFGRRAFPLRREVLPRFEPDLSSFQSYYP